MRGERRMAIRSSSAPMSIVATMATSTAAGIGQPAAVAEIAMSAPKVMNSPWRNSPPGRVVNERESKSNHRIDAAWVRPVRRYVKAVHS